MTLVKINALEIPSQAGEAATDELVKRFTNRLDSLSDVAGFEGFELLRPTGDNESRWFVYTRWLDQASYEAWRDGDGARNSHARTDSSRSDDPGPDGSELESQQDEDSKPQRPISMGATLLEFEVALSAGPSGV